MLFNARPKTGCILRQAVGKQHREVMLFYRISSLSTKIREGRTGNQKTDKEARPNNQRNPPGAAQYTKSPEKSPPPVTINLTPTVYPKLSSVPPVLSFFSFLSFFATGLLLFFPISLFPSYS